MSKHTPGPWELIPDGDRGVVIQARHAGMRLHVTYVQYAGADEEIARANARLIAECPTFYDLTVAVLALSSNPALLDKASEILARLE